MAFDGPNALANMGVIKKPLGTLDEIQEAGYDPKKTASCSDPGTPGVMPCPQASKCIFAQSKYGGFKYQGPKYIAYRLVTDEGTAKEDVCKCHTFMEHLYARMIHGQKRRLDGGRGEFIRIIGQEGDTYRPRVAVKKDKHDKRPDAEWVFETKPKKVPIHPRPQDTLDTDSDYNAAIVSAELHEHDSEQDLMDAAYREAMGQEKVFEDTPKRGRPKGSKNKPKAEPDVGQTISPE